VIIVCEDVARTFGQGTSAVVAVHGVSCRVARGQHVALIGPSGSGKSTLLHLMAGLDVPTAGTITWPELGDRTQLRPGPVGMVFQAPSLIPALDVVENVELPLLLGGLDRRDARAAATASLTRLGLDDLAAKLPEELSGGQSQRVAVARVLAGRPSVILADEPTGQLDHASAAVIVAALLDTATELGAALILTTHDPRIAASFDEIWRMDDGRLADRSMEEIPCSR
jgi:ABC-type lipoprotein export system ATPase subunit